MLDPLTIVDMAVAHFSPVNDLKHLNIMITAGPTREPLDPVRYISNHSSGKMGFYRRRRCPSWRERHAGIRSGFTTDATVC